MKKNIVLLVFSVFLIISCRKEGKIQEVTFNSTEYNDEPSDKVYKEQIAVSDFANSDLLIVTIPFYNNMFHFPNIESFYAVKEEIHQKRDEYQDYFIWRDLNFSSFDKVSKVESLFNEEMSESEVTQLLLDNGVEPNEYDEIDFKFPMLYQNLLLNVDGIVEIGNQFIMYNDTAKNIFDTKEQLDNYIVGRGSPSEIIPYKLYTSTESHDRSTSSSCECRRDFDVGRRCQDRRIRGTLDIHYEAYSNNSGCTVYYDMEVESRWYKRFALIWWRHKVDTINVDVNFSIENSRGGGFLSNICRFSGFRGKTNVNSVGISYTMECNNPAQGDNGCLSELPSDNNHTILTGNSSHWGRESGRCGGTASCDINGCI